MTQRGLDHVEHVGPDRDARYVQGRAPRRPDMCPECFSTDTLADFPSERDVGGIIRRCNQCGEIFE